MFISAQEELSIRYTEPLAKSISSYLEPLLLDKPEVKLEYNQINGFSGLKLLRGNEFYDFDSLSGGMKEQLSAALRLSIADVLKEEHNGSLPLVFDDAFTNSDPSRIPNIKKMLRIGSEKGLQIILLTCDPTLYQSFADETLIIK